MNKDAIWLQRERAVALKKKVAELNQWKLTQAMADHLKTKLAAGAPVYFYTTPGDANNLRRQLQSFFELEKLGATGGEIPARRFIRVNTGSNRYRELSPTVTATVYELWRLTAPRNAPPTETEREEALLLERQEIYGALVAENPGLATSLQRLEGIAADRAAIRSNRVWRERQAAAARQAAERKAQAAARAKRDAAARKRAANRRKSFTARPLPDAAPGRRYPGGRNRLRNGSGRRRGRRFRSLPGWFCRALRRRAPGRRH